MSDVKLACLGGVAAPAELTETFTRMRSLPERAQAGIWDVLDHVVVVRDPDAAGQRVEAFARLHEPTPLAEALCSSYPKAKERIRRDIQHRTLLDHGKVLTGLDWRIDATRASHRGMELDARFAVLTLHGAAAGSPPRACPAAASAPGPRTARSPWPAGSGSTAQSFMITKRRIQVATASPAPVPQSTSELASPSRTTATRSTTRPLGVVRTVSPPRPSSRLATTPVEMAWSTERWSRPDTLRTSWSERSTRPALPARARYSASGSP